MDSIALYYPYIHVRDDTWLKYAALYWPKLARLRPRDYPTFDSPVARALRNDARWLTDIEPPRWAATQVAPPFLELINTRTQDLRDSFGLHQIGQWGHGADTTIGYLDHSNVAGPPVFYGSAGGAPRSGPGVGPRRRVSAPRLDPRLGYIHADKIFPGMVEAATNAGLAILQEGHGGTWVGMHPELASVYTCALIERIAIEDHLHPVTDQTLPHSAESGWTLDRLMQTLTDKEGVGAVDTQTPRDLLDAFVFLAFETVVPADLHRVPIDKIIEVRSRFGTELDAFRVYVTQQVERLAELQDIRDLPVFYEYLQTEVQRTVSGQLEQLRERLRSVGLESARALVNVKSVALPPLAAAAAGAVGLSPAITGPAALAACVVTAPTQWRRQRREAIRESPVGYLFRINQELNPVKLIERLRRVWPT
ncbi:DUF6236 family protein [Amycolatopsis sp. NPDC049868]|uniref:DUF6236 family protein n=1 Tax=Amycolatopsis sp. NPDC049868 TaxID=3363934 RepID=UPI0037A15F0F